MSTPKKKPAFPEVRLEKDGVKLRQSARKAKPAKKPAARPTPQPPMIRLRLPSEKPTREDADDNGCIVVIWEKGQYDLRRWNHPFHHNIKAWIGRLPDGILPREPSQEVHQSIEHLIDIASGGMRPANGPMIAIRNGHKSLAKLQPFLKP